MNNSLQAYFVYKEASADKKADVDAHTRIVRGKLQTVKRHDRTIKGSSVPSTKKKISDEELWQQWNMTKDEELLEELLHRMTPVIKKHTSVYQGKVKIPDDAIELKFRIEAMRAIKSYNPDAGAKLSTYVYSNLRRVKRWIGENQNIGRIPENRLYKIATYNKAIGDLSEELGAAPDKNQIAKKLGWSVKEVDRMAAELRKDLTAQNFESDMSSHIPSSSEYVLRNFKYELEGKERILYEHLTGFGRKKITSTAELSKILEEPDYTISRMRKKIAEQIKEYNDKHTLARRG